MIQASLGVTLTVTWWRHGRHGAPTVYVHAAASIAGLALWVTFHALFAGVV